MLVLTFLIVLLPLATLGLRQTLRILPSFSSKRAMLPGSYITLDDLSDGQRATLDTVLAEAVVNGERAVGIQKACLAARSVSSCFAHIG